MEDMKELPPSPMIDHHILEGLPLSLVLAEYNRRSTQRRTCSIAGKKSVQYGSDVRMEDMNLLEETYGRRFNILVCAK